MKFSLWDLQLFQINSPGAQPQSFGTAPPPPAWPKVKAKFAPSRHTGLPGTPAPLTAPLVTPTPQLPSRLPASLQRRLPTERRVVPSTFHLTYAGCALNVTSRLVLDRGGQFVHPFVCSLVHSFIQFVGPQCATLTLCQTGDSQR